MLSFTRQTIVDFNQMRPFMYVREKTTLNESEGSVSTLALGDQHDTKLPVKNPELDQIKAIFPDLDGDFISRCLRDFSPERLIEMLFEDSLPADLHAFKYVHCTLHNVL